MANKKVSKVEHISGAQSIFFVSKFVIVMFAVFAMCSGLLLAGYFSVPTHAVDRYLDIGDASYWKRSGFRSTLPNISWGSWKPGLYFGMRSYHYPAFLSTGIMWTTPSSTAIRHSAKQDELTLFEWIRHDGSRYGKHRVVDDEMGIEMNSTFVIPMDESPAWSQRYVIRSKGASASFFFYFGTDCDGNLPEKECFGQNPTELYDIEEGDGGKGSDAPTRILLVRGKSRLSGEFLVKFTLHSDDGGILSYWSPSRQTVPYILKKVEDHASKGRKQNSRKDRIFKNDSSTFSNHWSHNTSAFAVQLSVRSHATLDITLLEHVPDRSRENDITIETISSWISRGENNFDSSYRKSYGLRTAGLGDRTEEICKRVISAVLGGVGLFAGHPLIGNSTDHLSQLTAKRGLTNNDTPIQLFTGTPSRTSFPRGFLWDEGFHLMITSQWNPNLGLDILSSWMESMFTLPYVLDTLGNIGTDSNDSGKFSELGWLPREMILGRDAVSVVPNEFVIQRVDIANPPTLMLVIEMLLNKVWTKERATCQHAETGDDTCTITEEASFVDATVLRKFLFDKYAAICKWMKWYFVTQRGPMEVPASFRWRGRSSSDRKLLANTLASGLDDYPRAVFPTKDEYHVDLLSWMTKFACIMASVDEFLDHGNEPAQSNFFSVLPDFSEGGVFPEVSTFHDLSQALSGRLDDLHWSDANQVYADVGLHSEEGQIVEEFIYRCLNPATRETVDVGLPAEIMFSKNQDFSEYCPSQFSRGYFLGGDNRGYLSRDRYIIRDGSAKIQHVIQKGYVSIFPLILKLIPSGSKKLDSTLNLIEAELMTPYGLRSLSPTSAFYGQSNAPGDNPYWRGYVWLNVNYLAITALHHYSAAAESDVTRRRCSDLYSTLRRNLIRNVINEYDRTGYLWEQYDDKSGAGIRGHPFSGWTALIVNIISESY